MDLFQIVWDALSPYMFDILKLAFGVTLFSTAIKVIRQKSGMVAPGSSNPWAGIWGSFLGYLLGRGIPILIGLTDAIVNDILEKL
ncbi:MAG: hypothetical protein WDA59_00180 [Methanofastidiosum sp.]|jgi:hypothetical protein